jgi:hypothetical protein
MNRKILKRLVFYGVRFLSFYGHPNEDEDAIQLSLSIYSGILSFIGGLTPAELVTIFPIEKRFDGDRFQCKDYFYTVDKLQKIGIHTEIGADQVSRLLWDYENDELREFLVNYLGVIDDLRRLEGQPGMVEEFFAKNGIPSYTLHENPETGQKFVINSETHRSVPVNRPIPKYLKLL